MGYSYYKNIRTVVKKFNLDVQMVNLFDEVIPLEPSTWLVQSLEKAGKMPATNEKTKAERVISPILLSVFENYSEQISFFSGEALNVNVEDNLSGECDFFFALHPPKPYIDAPIISLAEAKDEDMEWGLAQCAAQMYGAKLFNETEGKDIKAIYGCATDGIEWQFLRFENNIFYINKQILTQLPQILGAWHWIIQGYLK